MPMLQGTVRWAKIVGKPSKGYTPGEVEKEWSVDVYTDEKTLKELKKAGAGKYIKADKEGEDRITFKRRAYNLDPATKVRSLDIPAKPIKIVNAKGEEWDGKTLIGNGSKVNVKYALNDVNGAQKPSIIALQVVELVAYEGKAQSDDDEFPNYDAGEEAPWA